MRVSERLGRLIRRVSGSGLAPAAVTGIAVVHVGSGPGSCRRWVRCRAGWAPVLILSASGRLPVARSRATLRFFLQCFYVLLPDGTQETVRMLVYATEWLIPKIWWEGDKRGKRQ